MALAAILLARFDLTLLDEPTNDLDFDGLARLEDMVARRTGGMVIVSHDRAFLERTVTDVLELDEHSATGRRLRGRLGRVSERARRRPGPRRRGPRGLRVAARRPAPPGPARAPVGHQRRRPGEEASAGQRQVAAQLPHGAHREAGGTGPAHGAGPRRAGGGGEALGGLGPPLRHQRDRTLGRRRGPAGGCRRASGATSRSGPSRWTSPGPSGWRSSVPTGRARPPSSRPSSGACPSPPAPGGWVRASWWASSPRTGASWATSRAWATPSWRRRASPRPGPLATGQVRARGRRGPAARLDPLAGRAHPGRAGRLRRAGRQFPGAGRAHQPSRSARHRAARIGVAGLRRDAPPGLPRPAPARDGDHDPPRGVPERDAPSRGLRKG